MTISSHSFKASEAAQRSSGTRISFNEHVTISLEGTYLCWYISRRIIEWKYSPIDCLPNGVSRISMWDWWSILSASSSPTRWTTRRTYRGKIYTLEYVIILKDQRIKDILREELSWKSLPHISPANRLLNSAMHSHHLSSDDAVYCRDGRGYGRLMAMAYPCLFEHGELWAVAIGIVRILLDII